MQVTARISVLLASIALFPAAGCAQKSNRADTAATSMAQDSSLAVRQFVQGFFDWYTPIAVSDTGQGPQWWSVLTQADRYLDRALATALRGDSIARLASPERQTREILNFDPFLNSQDPCGPNEVMEVIRVGSVFRVPIRSCGARRANMTVEVRAVDGRFRISTVIYNSGRDLKYWLCKYAKEDSRPQRRPASC
jgi:hypothetical protein